MTALPIIVHVPNTTSKAGDALPQKDLPESCKYPNATAEDYCSLLALKTPDHQSMSVKNFNEKLLEWGNANPDRSARILEDVSQHDLPVGLCWRHDERGIEILERNQS